MNHQELAVFGAEISVYPLPATGSVRIGRAVDNDVCLDHPSISRHHAVLHLGPPICIEDLGSANGTAIAPPGHAPETQGTDSVRRGSGASFGVESGDSILLGAVSCAVRRARDTLSDLPGSGVRRRDDAPRLDVIVQDPAMLALYEDARAVAWSPLSILVLGETGVGKEVLAREVHRASPRAGGPFFAIHCGALSDTLLESELFGHERGAFTGADRARPGLIESADGGTLFLDEVGELGPLAQMKLLRVLEDRVVLRIGGRSAKSVDVRFIAATNRDLEAEIQRKAFREDLYYRLNGFTLLIPPLRSRRGEIQPLAEAFLRAACLRARVADPPRISEEAMAALLRHAWAGNVRELRNVMERAAILAGSSGQVRLDHLPAKVATPSSPPPPREEAGAFSVRSAEDLRHAAEALERRRILDALERCGGNQTRAAEVLGLSRRTLVNRLSVYDFPRPRKR